MTRHVDAWQLTDAQWDLIRSQDCEMCGQPYHRFCTHDPEHEWAPTACINALQGRIEELEADRGKLILYGARIIEAASDLVDAAASLIQGDHRPRNPSHESTICDYCGFRWPCDAERAKLALAEWKRVRKEDLG